MILVRRVVTVILAIIGAGLLAAACASASTPAYTFDAEFNGPAGSAPDPAQWGYDLGSTGWGAGQLETYTRLRSNSYMDGRGHLIIAVTRTGGTYQSARLVSRATFAEGDTIEARIRLDVQPGVWPAWWLLGATRPWPAGGEVDMLENYRGNTTETTVHTPDGAGVFSKVAQLSVNSGWHTYEVQWTSSGFVFYRDGRRYLSVSPAQLKNWGYNSGKTMHMILNVAVGGIAGIPPVSVQFPVRMEVDWVRAWSGSY